MATLISIQVGMPETRGDPAATQPNQKQWRSAIFKSAISGPVQVHSLGLEGDGQADLRFHGGPDKAILAYSADHYPHWFEMLQIPEMSSGAFGENLTIAGLTEETVCLGDTWKIGSAVLQVSQPRQPCWKLARKWETPELPKLVVKTGWSGWYLRVLTPGRIEEGMTCELVSRPHPEWSISQCSRALYDSHFSMELAQSLLQIAELSEAWKEDLEGRLGTRIGSL